MRGGMADTLVLGANAFGVWVQVPPHAPSASNPNLLPIGEMFGFVVYLDSINNKIK